MKNFLFLFKHIFVNNNFRFYLKMCLTLSKFAENSKLLKEIVFQNVCKEK